MHCLCFCLEDFIEIKDEYFHYRGEDCLDVVIEKVYEILEDFVNSYKRKIIMTYVGKKHQKAKTICYLYHE